jgi:hypothetical protein
VVTDAIPTFCFVVADFTPSLSEVLTAMDAQLGSDGHGYSGYHRNYRIYYEVIDYNKLVRDAKKRNRIFFDKLNILGNR